MENTLSFNNEDDLEYFLSIPYAETVELMKRLDGDFMILGIGGKMGPTLGRMIVLAAEEAGISKKVYGVSRFSNRHLIPRLENWGIRCISCDLLHPEEAARLPKVKNIIFMAGRKFGQTGSDYLTWALNVIVPNNAAACFTESRFVVFSTGSIYDLWPSDSDGPSESDTTYAIGEYANSCLGRERIFEYYSRTYGTKVLLFRLNYAIDLRYGVLLEIGKQVYEGKPNNLAMGYANVIWQGDANNLAIRCLELAACPPRILNVTGDKIRIRDIALRFGKIMDRKAVFSGNEAPTALLSSNTAMKGIFGAPPTSIEQMLRWITDWIVRGGKSLDKPTHYQTRDGQFLDT
ncbi:MAG: NAD(P)-dependent oxidoreductase [Candidatus Latescibacter sp.]|nr:NAD(P)-dependent oxidoreductase [Candidatus Latescibacter sp.]